MSSKWSIKTVGPTILMDNKHHGSYLLEVNSEICLDCSDKRHFRSVVYVSLGSVAILGEEQMEELARGLMKSDYYFLWMVKASEECKLPMNFKSEIQGKGIIVNWCPQLKLLAHQAVACFMTHCGRNLMLEALSLGISMIAMPQMIDQIMNAKFVADIWQARVRVKVNDKGIVTIEEIKILLREVTEGERGKELEKKC
ncbi:hypothetical protein ACH5RR_013158 [Cinchona calisaya]|uniref:Uncharacterized protein n=1 Tax=Cinchona calisaya TaxID=153742 RepID=A0ABD3A1F8_9GENT